MTLTLGLLMRKQAVILPKNIENITQCVKIELKMSDDVSFFSSMPLDDKLLTTKKC